MRKRPGKPSQGLINVGGTVIRCALGKAGTTPRKREGDGATPLARLRVLGGYYRNGGVVSPKGPLRLRRIGGLDGWCDAPADRNYNRPVKLPYPASHETLRRADHLYDVCIVLDWNVRPRMRNRGSAIFLHLARDGYMPTEGCIALSPRDMARLMPLLGRAEFRVLC